MSLPKVESSSVVLCWLVNVDMNYIDIELVMNVKSSFNWNICVAT